MPTRRRARFRKSPRSSAKTNTIWVAHRRGRCARRGHRRARQTPGTHRRDAVRRRQQRCNSRRPCCARGRSDFEKCRSAQRRSPQPRQRAVLQHAIENVGRRHQPHSDGGLPARHADLHSRRQAVARRERGHAERGRRHSLHRARSRRQREHHRRRTPHCRRDRGTRGRTDDRRQHPAADEHGHGLRAGIHRDQRLRPARVRDASGRQRDRRARPRAQRVHADHRPASQPPDHRPRREGLQPARQRDRSEGQRQRGAVQGGRKRRVCTCRTASLPTRSSACRSS